MSLQELADKFQEKYGNNQYFHDQVYGHTYAVEVSFNREDLLETIHHFDQAIAFKIGKSTVHPNDNYCKKTGREVSTSKMKPVMLYLDCVTKKGEDHNKLFLTYKNLETNEIYAFRISSNSDKPHFVSVYY